MMGDGSADVVTDTSLDTEINQRLPLKERNESGKEVRLGLT